jgi:hypothetical protein
MERHVRTPEGAEHFGQPIGAVITEDVVERTAKASLSVIFGGGDFDLDPNVRASVMDVLNDLADQYPLRGGPIHVRCADGGDEGDVAEWDGATRSILLRPAFVDTAKIESLSAMFDGVLVAGGRTVAETRRAILTHEYGHALERTALNPSLMEGTGQAAWDARQALVQEERTVQFNDGSSSTAPRWQHDPLLEDGSPQNGPEVRARSFYATENAMEWFAEAFADAVLNKDPTPAGRDVLAWMKRWVVA